MTGETHSPPPTPGLLRAMECFVGKTWALCHIGLADPYTRPLSDKMLDRPYFAMVDTAVIFYRS